MILKGCEDESNLPIRGDSRALNVYELQGIIVRVVLSKLVPNNTYVIRVGHGPGLGSDPAWAEACLMPVSGLDTEWLEPRPS